MIEIKKNNSDLPLKALPICAPRYCDSRVRKNAGCKILIQIALLYDLKDHECRVFHPKGTKVNPLDTHSFRCPFLFVDGNDPIQVAWAIKQHHIAEAVHKLKIILVQGAPYNLSKKLNLPIYFDQSVVLVRKFGIVQVPARVFQKERGLIVDEISLDDEPHLPDSTGLK